MRTDIKESAVRYIYQNPPLRYPSWSSPAFVKSRKAVSTWWKAHRELYGRGQGRRIIFKFGFDTILPEVLDNFEPSWVGTNRIDYAYGYVEKISSNQYSYGIATDEYIEHDNEFFIDLLFEKYMA